MEFKLEGGALTLEKELSDLDKLVIEFASLLDQCKIRYVIVSGYLAILFGRTRGTEDVDLFVERMDHAKFSRFLGVLDKRGYWILNAENGEEGFDMLNDKLAIRVAKKGDAVPNLKMKYQKNDLDHSSLEHPLKVSVSGNNLLVSQLEIQIPFKLWLGSDKDIEDAVHIYELFKEKLNKTLMARAAEKLNVKKEMEKYGIL